MCARGFWVGVVEREMSIETDSVLSLCFLNFMPQTQGGGGHHIGPKIFPRPPSTPHLLPIPLRCPSVLAVDQALWLGFLHSTILLPETFPPHRPQYHDHIFLS